MNSVGPAGEVDGGSGCWEGAQGKNGEVGREALIVSECSGLCVLLERVFR